VEAVRFEDVEAARDRIAGVAVRTPLVRLNVEDAPAEIWLKLENLQPIGAFKLRGAANAILSTDRAKLADGVWTASAGNMSQGVAWCARELGVPCAVVVPEHAPQTKLEATRRLGAEIVEVPFDEWFEVFHTHVHERMQGLFVHAFDDPDVMAGNGTIALELVEDLPEFDTVVVPYGGGGLTNGVASALRELRPGTRIFAAEVDTGAPLAASLAAGEPTRVQYTRSFIDGIGGPEVLPGVFEQSKRLVDGSLVVSVEQVADAVRLLAVRNRIVAEGAGAAGVAAAVSGMAGGGRIVCIVSGGNIDGAVLARILLGEAP
jgi:threonine dehydratase